ncbi:hypothetical protein LXA43DRAFT_1097962 [Ganoderma leucocontextum]|nr:hypothetical protein LXA43DRAFT_1105750 [Ganoderma leucocontextum]KAI1787782.1 hypothetical protein LXA43DRAFT_1097962 [Ganoderma leucocontextum]
MKLALLSVVVAAAISAVCAQGLSPCLVGCINTAGKEAGCSGTNISCMCTSSKFQGDMLACLEAKCTPADLQAAKAFEAEFCGSSSEPDEGVLGSDATA